MLHEWYPGKAIKVVMIGSAENLACMSSSLEPRVLQQLYVTGDVLRQCSRSDENSERQNDLFKLTDLHFP